jgi:cholesterol transport system auxiliary component
MTRLPFLRQTALCAAATTLILTAGCAALLAKSAPQPAFYAIDASSARPTPLPTGRTGQLPTLIVEPPHAASGFDNSRIIYIREPHRLEYFAHSEWVDPPARMIAPLIVAAVEGSGAFSAVVDAAGAAAADIRLTTEILRLQQDFGSSPSRVRFTLRATLVDSVKRRVIAVREFDASVAAASDDTVGGVAAANLAVDQVLQALAAFCAAAAREPLNASPQCPSCGDNAGK